MAHTPSSSDTFRINMKNGFGANLPASPAPISPATQWWDVSNWQTFLMGIGELTGGSYPTNMYDANTVNATKNFQASTAFGAALTATGIVNQATFNKAVANGMIQFPTVIVT